MYTPEPMLFTPPPKEAYSDMDVWYEEYAKPHRKLYKLYWDADDMIKDVCDEAGLSYQNIFQLISDSLDYGEESPDKEGYKELVDNIERYAYSNRRLIDWATVVRGLNLVKYLVEVME